MSFKKEAYWWEIGKALKPTQELDTLPVSTDFVVIGAFKEFVEDVNNGNFPEEPHLVRMQPDELSKFRELLDKI